MNLRIQHRSTYRYREAVSFGTHELRMRPREGHGLHMEKCRIAISPPGHRIRWQRDVYENNIGIVEFTEPARELVIDCEFVVRACDENPFNFVISPEASRSFPSGTTWSYIRNFFRSCASSMRATNRGCGSG